MADPLATLNVVVFGDTRPLDAALNAAQRRLQNFARRGALAGMTARGMGSLATGLVSPITNVFQKAQRVWENSLSIGGLAAGGGIAFAAKQAIDLESAFVQINKAANLPAGEFAKLQEGVRGLAVDSELAGVSLDELLGITLQGAKLGLADKEGVDGLLQYVRALSLVSISIDDLPIDEVARSLGQVSNIFGMGTDQALGYASAVDALADSSTANAGEIFDVAQRAAGSAKSLGLGVDQLLGLSTALLDVGFGAERAGTTLNRIFSEIAVAPGEFAKNLGMDEDAFRALGPMEQVQAVLQHLATLPAGSAGFEFLADVGVDGAFAKQALLQLSQTQGNLARLTATANEELRTGAHVMASAAMGSDTAQSSLTQLWNRVRLLAQEFGQHLLPIVEGVATGLGSMFTSMSGWLESNESQLKAWGESIGSAIAQLGQLLSSSEGWSKFGDAMMESFKLLMQNIVDLAVWAGGRIGTALADGLLTGLNPVKGMGPEAQAVANFAMGPIAQLFGGGKKPLPPRPGSKAAKAAAAAAAPPAMPGMRNIFAPFQKAIDEANPVDIFGALGGGLGGIGRDMLTQDQRLGTGFGAVGALAARPAIEEPAIVEGMKGLADAISDPNVWAAGIRGGFDAAKDTISKAVSPFGAGTNAQSPGLTAFGALGGLVAGLGAEIAAKAPAGSMTGQTFALPEFARQLQQGAFGKKDENQFAKLTADRAKTMVDKLTSIDKKFDRPAGPAVAVGPA